MNNQEIIEILYGIRANNLNLDDTYTKYKYDAINEAIKAIKKLDYINVIIHNTQEIQEDVIRYKMICEVLENE